MEGLSHPLHLSSPGRRRSDMEGLSHPLHLSSPGRRRSDSGRLKPSATSVVAWQAEVRQWKA
jgi:hypothetical protein